MIVGVLFAFIISGLTDYELWGDEAWSLWAVRESFPQTIYRVAADVHPPFYFILLDVWGVLAGDSVYASRYLSALFGMLALATTYRFGKQLFDEWTGLVALVWLGTHNFFIYYTRDIRMYPLLLWMATLSMLLYCVWLRQLTWRLTSGYAVAMATLPYTHYYGLFIILAQGFHVAINTPRLLGRWLLVGSLAGLFYLPWIPILLLQILDNPNGPLTKPVPTNWDSIYWLGLLLTSGAGGWIGLPFLMGRAFIKLPQYRQECSLLMIWFVLTPMIIFTLNDWVPSFYEARYTIAILPALALLIGYGLRHTLMKGIGLLILIGLLYFNLTSYDWLWPPKVTWETDWLKTALEKRQPNEPTLLMIMEASSLEAYYDPILNLRNQAALDLSGERYTTTEINRLLRPLKSSPTIWVMMPHNIPESWLVMANLNQNYTVKTRHHADYMLFYQFAQDGQSQLQFQFDNQLQYQTDLFADLPILEAKDRFCPTLQLKALTDIKPHYSYGVHLVNQANQLIAQQDAGLGEYKSGASITLNPCLTIPTDIPPADCAVHLIIYQWVDGQRLPIYEHGNQFWGHALPFEVITIQ